MDPFPMGIKPFETRIGENVPQMAYLRVNLSILENFSALQIRVPWPKDAFFFHEPQASCSR